MQARHGAAPLLHDYLSHSTRRLPYKVALVCMKQRVPDLPKTDTGKIKRAGLS